MGEDAPVLECSLRDDETTQSLTIPIAPLGDGARRQRAWHKMKIVRKHEVNHDKNGQPKPSAPRRRFFRRGRRDAAVTPPPPRRGFDVTPTAGDPRRRDDGGAAATRPAGRVRVAATRHRRRHLYEGGLQLMLHWIHNPALAFDPFPGRRSDASGKRPNAVRVGLARGRRVASGPNQVYHRGHHARLRVQFSVDGGAGPKAVATSSTTESATFDPVWCETFELPYAEPGAPSVFGAAPASTASLTMTVEGREADADEFTRMGSCTLLLESLRKAPPRRWYALDGDRGELDLLLDWRYASRCDPFKRDGKTGNTPMKRLVEAVGPVGTSPAGRPRGQSRKISRRDGPCLVTAWSRRSR